MLNLQKVKDLAKEKNISLNDVAAKLEMSPQALSRMLKENSTKISTLEQLSSIFNVSIAYFFDEDEIHSEHQRPNQPSRQNVVIPQSVLEMLAEKDRQIARLTELLIAQGK